MALPSPVRLVLSPALRGIAGLRIIGILALFEQCEPSMDDKARGLLRYELE